MANPTTNFGWVMPTSTSLVTNLPADFNTFGQAVDTSMSELLGGTTGQVLSKTSATNMDFTWVTPTDQTPLTTKGDLFAFTTVDARLAVGANETRLVADSVQATGLKYVADTTNYAINAKGDLLAGTAADTLAALTVGTNGQVLTADSTVSPSGLKWATPSTSPFVLVATNTFTATTSVAINNCFTSTYKNYKVLFSIQSGTTGDVNFAMRASSTNATTNWYGAKRITDYNGTSTNTLMNNATYMSLMQVGTYGESAMEGIIFNPQLAERTSIATYFFDSNSNATGTSSAKHSVATSYDGCQFIWTGNATGEIRIYGVI